MKRLILLITLIIAGRCAFAQIGTPMLQYYGNQITFNPAYAGVSDNLLTTLSVRKQWAQFPGSPTLVSLNAHAPFKHDKHAWGVVIQNETYGALSRTLGYANYAYKLWLQNGELRLGLQAGFHNHILNWNKIEHIKDPNDPNLGKNRTQNTGFDVNVGAYYLAYKYYVGFSIKHLMPPKLDFEKNRPSNTVWHPHPATQFLLHGGTEFEITRDWLLLPKVFLQYTPTSPLSINMGMYGSFQEQYFFGVNYQTVQKSMNFSLRVFITEVLQLSYSYGIYLNVFESAKRGGSHEISLTYRYEPVSKFTKPKRFFD